MMLPHFQRLLPVCLLLGSGLILAPAGNGSLFAQNVRLQPTFESRLTSEPDPFVILPVGFLEEVSVPDPSPTPPGAAPAVLPHSPSTSLRDQLRESIQREGEEHQHDHHSLTRDVTQLLKWTTVILLLAGGGLFAMKRLGLQPAVSALSPSRPSGMKVLETLSFGRNQGLHLVEVGSERLLVAADAGGIRAVTLLPSWPGNDSEMEPEILQTPTVFQQRQRTVG